MIKQGVSLLAGCLIALSLCSCTRDLAHVNESAESAISEKSSEPVTTGSESTTITQPVESLNTTLSKAETTTSKKPTTTTTRKTTTKATASPLDVPLVFNDVQAEELIRDFVDKPSGNVYPRDFDEFINTTQAYVLQYQSFNNLTFMTEWTGTGKHGEISGKAASYKALSTVPFRNIYLRGVPDVSPFCSTGTLESITIYDAKVENFRSFSNCKKLETLKIELCTGVDFSLLNSMKSVKYIDIKDSGVSGLSTLKSFANLTDILLYSNSPSDYAALKGHPYVENLNIRTIAGMDFTMLTTLPKLKVLRTQGNEVIPSHIYSKLVNKGVSINPSSFPK